MPGADSVSVPGAGLVEPADRVVLVEGSAFGISTRSGDMRADLPEGLFFRDTRFLSQLELRLNGSAPEPLAVHGEDPFSAVFVLRDRVPPDLDRDAPIRPDSRVVVQRSRYVGRGMREDISLRNFGDEATFCLVELEVDADFAPIFDARDQRVDPRRAEAVRVTAEHARLAFRWQRGGHSRAVWVDFSESPRFDGRIASWEIIVPARGAWSVCVQVTPVMDGDPIEPRYRCGQPVDRAEPRARFEGWRDRLPKVSMGNETFQALVGRAAVDLASLRIHDPEYPERVVVAAGAPWFMALSGRDALLTSWMTMMFDPDLALGTLQTLARFQGRDVNPVTEEEPGRILAQTRFGESAGLSLAGGRSSYASADATPLYVMVLGELARWGTRRHEVDALLPSADRALNWIVEHGDRDGDGYVEYQRATDRGPAHQGWKHSAGAISFASGEPARGPIALCEVQAYVYGALVARAHFATEQGDAALGERLRKQATALKEAFNQDFWLEDRGYYALALDSDKRPVDVPASNMGHCLWTGIVDTDKAPSVVRTLLGPDLFSGWGVRTLASSSPAYNPVSAHTGGVWPHDNAILVAGLMRYGFVEEAHRLCRALVAAGAHFGARMPELFAGFSRAELPFPVTYPTSCSPRAWAAASPLLLLRSLLRLEPDIRNARLHLAPALPDWVGTVQVTGVPVMDGHIAFEATGSTCIVTEAPDDLEIVREPRKPTV